MSWSNLLITFIEYFLIVLRKRIMLERLYLLHETLHLMGFNGYKDPFTSIRLRLLCFIFIVLMLGELVIRWCNVLFWQGLHVYFYLGLGESDHSVFFVNLTNCCYIWHSCSYQTWTMLVELMCGRWIPVLTILIGGYKFVCRKDYNIIMLASWW